MSEKSKKWLIILSIIIIFLIIIKGLSTYNLILGLSISPFNVGVCLNSMPVISNTTCPLEIYDNDILNCQFFANDTQPQPCVFSSSFEGNNSLFIINLNGTISKILTPLDIGNYTYNITVNDGGCANNESSETFFINVLSSGNHAPIFIANISNQTMVQDSTKISFDLNDNFIDIEDDEIFYNHTLLLSGFSISISPTGVVTFYATDGFFGEVPIQIIATDVNNVSTYSNTFWVEVTQSEEIETEENSVTTTSGGIVISTPGNETICFSDWECGDWSKCLIVSYKIRGCMDINNCSVATSKPPISEECEYISTCFDRIKNGDEEGIDCGGLCERECIPKCFDNTKNGDEEGIDCGGSCEKKCPISIFDNMKNMYEDESDTKSLDSIKSNIEESPKEINPNSNYVYFFLLILGILSIYSLVIIFKRIKLKK